MNFLITIIVLVCIMLSMMFTSGTMCGDEVGIRSSFTTGNQRKDNVDYEGIVQRVFGN